MSRNGSGVFTLVAGNPVVTGTTIASTWANNTLSDIASALTDSVAADGQTAMTGNLNLNSNKIVNLATPTLSTDAVTKAYVDTADALSLLKASNLSDVANATTARTNISAAKSGANSDITSLTGLTTPLSQAQGGTGTTTGYYGFKNRIINSAMVIDQRNAGASVTPTVDATYTLDRWAARLTQASKYSIQQNAGAVTPPAGFTNYLGVTSLSAYSVGASDFFVLQQQIEGFNIADLGFGTANAKTITISFWVRSSLTGTFGGSIYNAGGTRNYPFTYTISVANTWEQKSVTIAGDTSGTWATNNSSGLQLQIGLGVGSTYSGTAGAWAATNYLSATGATSVVGTNGATFYITGVQLEVGSTATSFDYRPYGTELALCQRYYYKSVFSPISAYSPTSSRADGSHVFPVPMRTAPTALEQTGTASDYGVYYQSGGTISTSVPTFASPTTANGGFVRFNCSAVFTIGQGALMAPYTTGAYLAWSAEL
jgi:hypothetical protein